MSGQGADVRTRPEPRVSPSSSSRRLLLSLAAVLLTSAPALAGDVLDFTAIDQHAAAQAAATTGRLRKAYLAIRRTAAGEAPPGLRGDFHRLRVISTTMESRLFGDDVLAGHVFDALVAGQAALADARSGLVEITAALDSDEDRARCGEAGAAAGVLASRADEARNLGRTESCARFGRRAAKKYAAGVALATKLLARQDAREPAWSAPLHDLDGALLSVWAEPGTTPAVYAVGSHDADGPLFLRMGGEGWVRVPVAADGDLWWVAGIGDGVYAAGTGGRVVRYDPATGALTDRSTGIATTLFGIWGSSETNLWAVGGNVDGAAPRSVLLHHDGTSWTSLELPAGTNDRTIFKVWGTSAEDVWACGQAGLILHFDGTAWTVQDSDTFESLFTIHGDSPTIAVGGTVQPGITERGAQGFLAATVPVGSETLRGVFVPPSGDAFAAGFASTVLRRNGSRWERVSGLPDTSGRDFHAVAMDDGGGVYVAGGNLVTMGRGTLLYFGPRRIPGGVFPQAKFRERVQPVLYAGCAFTGCHVQPFVSEDLDLGTAEASLATLLGVASNQSPLLRVLPGRPSQSYLFHKLLGTQAAAGGSGDPMPQGENRLPQADLDLIRAWILEGARDN